MAIDANHNLYSQRNHRIETRENESHRSFPHLLELVNWNQKLVWKSQHNHRRKFEFKSFSDPKFHCLIPSNFPFRLDWHLLMQSRLRSTVFVFVFSVFCIGISWWICQFIWFTANAENVLNLSWFDNYWTDEKFEDLNLISNFAPLKAFKFPSFSSSSNFHFHHRENLQSFFVSVLKFFCA